MANIDFSKSGQDKALEFIGKDMLVSASAGSGKTTVMVEKILRYLEKGSVTRIIVLTFTKASAQDMKEKLTERLYREIRMGGELAEHYKRELQLLPFAYIGTIDAICGEIYKRYFEEIGVSPGLEILDEADGKALLNTAISEVIDECIKAGDPAFNELGTLFSDGKSYEKLKEPINEILSFLSAQENPSIFMAYATLEAEKPFIESNVIKDTIARFRKKFSLFATATEDLIAEAKTYAPQNRYEKCYQKATELNDLVWDVTHADDTAFIERIIGVEKLLSLPSSSKGDADYVEYLGRVKKVNDAIKGLVAQAQKIFTGTLAECELEDADSRRLAKMLLETVVKVRQKYSELKEEEGKADFEDIERYALQILSRKNIAKEFSEGIDYIFLDEYQDTNRLQEAIFDKIARGNLFMVGDVKQAIYGFREADPDIFLEKHRRFKEDEIGKNVPLNKNFRSDQKVLKFVDDVFSEVMTYDFGGIDYRKESRFGEAGLALNANGSSPEVEVAVFTPEKKESEVPTGVYSVKEGAKTQIEFKKEDYYIANKIKELVGAVTVYDKNLGSERPLRYGDIAILYRYKKGAQGTRKVLDKYRIPYVAEGFEGERDMRDINAINCFLKVLDNHKEDYALCGAMLSCIGGFGEGELSEIRNQNLKEPFFHQAVTLYQGRLNDKIAEFNQKVKKYRKLSAL
ncbi:MAG: UvrD-helicase domain-containing protein, partial [Clostridia bacterium]|nr:UvrD-helicase domain-containing protein [Clostridia bacterium]